MGTACLWSTWHQLGGLDCGLESLLSRWLTHMAGKLVLALTESSARSVGLGSSSCRFLHELFGFVCVCGKVAGFRPSIMREWSGSLTASYDLPWKSHSFTSTGHKLAQIQRREHWPRCLLMGWMSKSLYRKHYGWQIFGHFSGNAICHTLTLAM